MTVTLRTKRIIAAVEAEDDESVLSLAEILSQALNAEVLGLYLEDEELVSAAALPFTRSVAFGSGEIRAFEPPQLEQAFRAAADRLRRRFRETQGRARAPWSLEVVRGAGHSAALAVAGENDLLVLTRRQRRRLLEFVHGGVRCSMALAPAERGRSSVVARSVAVFYTGDARVLRFAADLATALGAGLRVLVVDREESLPVRALLRRARAWLRRNARSAEVDVQSFTAARDALSGLESGILVSALRGEQEARELESLVQGMDSWTLVLLRS